MPLKTIRLEGALLALVVGFFCLVAIGGLFGAVTVLWPPPGWHHYDGAVAALLCLFWLAVAGVAAWLAWLSLKARTEFYPDRIVYTGGFGIRELRRADVLGYRWIGNNETYIRLNIRDAKPIRLSASVLADPALQAWFTGIADLDEQDREAAERTLEADPAWGSDLESRRKLLARLRLVARVMTWAAWAIGAWLWLKPQPYPLAIATACALPLVAILIQLTSGGRFSLAVDTIKTDARPSLGTLFWIAGGTLALRTLTDFSFLDWKALLVASLAGGLCLTMVSAILDGKLGGRWGIWSAVFLAWAAYSYGVFAQGDVLLDNAAPQKFSTMVREMNVSHGKSTRYVLHVAPWGPVENETEISVTRAFYDTTKIGQTICIYLKPGRFGVRWYSVGDC